MPLLIEPYCGAVATAPPGAGECSLVALRPLEPFSVRMKAAVVVGLFVGGPVLLTSAVAFALVFELPLVLIFLSLAGLLQAATLRVVRPYAVVAMVALSAVITPNTDAVTLLFMAGPMLAFYELSILASWLIERSRRRRGTLSER